MGVSATAHTRPESFLFPINPNFHQLAKEYLAQGDVPRFLFLVDSQNRIELLEFNRGLEKDSGQYEEAHLLTYTACRVNFHHISLNRLRSLFTLADRERLRAVGQPLPGPGPYLLYRGVSGRGRSRRVKGISWTASLETARWFAKRCSFFDDPAVYQVEVQEHHVLAYLNERKEQEFLVLLPPRTRPVRIETCSPHT